MDVTTWTAVYLPVPEGFIAFVEELPGANTQGATLEEARANLQEAIDMVLEANRVLAEESPTTRVAETIGRRAWRTTRSVWSAALSRRSCIATGGVRVVHVTPAEQHLQRLWLYKSGGKAPHSKRCA